MDVVPTCDSRNRVGQPLPRSRGRAARARGRRRPAPCRHRRRHRAGPIGIRKDMEVRQRRRLEIRGQLLEVVVGLAGEADDDVGADRGVGIRARMSSTSAGSTRSCTAGASRRARDRSRAAAAGGNAARSSRRRDEIDDLGVQSIGSSELMRNRTSTSGEPHARPSALQQAAASDDSAASRSRPYEPRWTPVSAISLKPAAATRSTSRENAVERHAPRRPRVVGMMQYEQGSAQPVCTRKVKAVRPATPGSIARRSRRRRRRSARRSLRRGRRCRAASAASRPSAACRRWRTTRTTFGQVGDLVGPPGRVAAGHDDCAAGIGARDAADRLPRALIGARRHRAGVDDDEVGVLPAAARSRLRATRSSSKPSESAWLTRQPKVTTAYFTAALQQPAPCARCRAGTACRRTRSARRRRRRARSPRRKSRPAADDGQHAPAGGHELSVAHAPCPRDTPTRRASLRPRSMPSIGWPDSDDSG